ncbi:MAG: hemolysin III family protein [Deltaproteobacteria bacterium]|nr:hemolysin III family protein [Deltaproteobacteria bacterium]
MENTERFNSISHLIGTAAAVAGMVCLLWIAARQGDPWKVVSFSIYGLTLVFLYCCSSLYHGLKGERKRFFRQLDHHAIYLLIAGTYTPLTLVALRGAWGWSLFGIVWGLAAVGIVLESLSNGRRRILPVAVYLLMGWSCVLGIKPLLQALPYAGFMWLLAGGIFYTAGVVFYGLGKKMPLFHAVWHLFVLAGSVCHYCAVLFYVA